MARNANSLAYQLKLWLLVYWLPSQAIAEAFPVILGAYVTVLSLLRNLAASDSQNDLNSGFFNFTWPATITAVNYTVSNAVLWVCREGSSDGDFYRTLYQMAIGCLIAFHLLTSFSRFFTARFWFAYETTESGETVTISRYSKDDGIAFVTILGAIPLNLAFLLLLLSFDITPWSCIGEPSTVSTEYISFSNRFDIQIPQAPGAITFQKVASILSAVLASLWLAIRIVFFCRDVINGEVERRLNNFRDAPDTGATNNGNDHELLEVNVKESN